MQMAPANNATVRGRLARRELAQKWPVVITAMLGIIPLMLPVHAAGVFMAIWREEFGWSQAGIAGGLSLYIVVAAIMAPVMGIFVDRYGARHIALPSMALLIPAYWGFALLQPGVGSLYAAFAVLAIVGAGTSQVIFCRPIVQSFDRARGIALALAQSGTAISILFAPFLSFVLIGVVGWRQAWWFMAIVPALGLLLIWLCLPPSDGPAIRTAAKRPALPDPGFTQAVRSTSFWILVLSFSLFYFGTAATMGQLIPILSGIGMTTQNAIAAQGLMGAAVFFGRLATGYMLDRVFAAHVYFGMGLLAAFGFALLSAGSASFAWVAVPCIGIAVGAEIDIASYMVSRYFGRQHFGKLFGLTFAVFCMGGVAAHPFYGLIMDVSGTYVAATMTSAIVILVAAGMLLRQKPYPVQVAAPAA